MNDTVRRALDSAAAAFRVPASAILGPGKEARIVRARWAAMKLLKDCGWTFSQIGRAFVRDHTSVMYGVKCAATMPTAWHTAYAEARARMVGVAPPPRIVYVRPIGPPEATAQAIRAQHPQPAAHDVLWAKKLAGMTFESVTTRWAPLYREAFDATAPELAR